MSVVDWVCKKISLESASQRLSAIAISRQQVLPSKFDACANVTTCCSKGGDYSIACVQTSPLPQDRDRGRDFSGARLFTYRLLFEGEINRGHRGTVIIRGNSVFVKPLNKFISGVSGHSCKGLILILSILIS